jgi:hypothetical protein
MKAVEIKGNKAAFKIRNEGTIQDPSLCLWRTLKKNLIKVKK